MYRAHICNLRTRDTEAGQSPAGSRPGLYSDTKPENVRNKSSLIVEAGKLSDGISQRALENGCAFPILGARLSLTVLDYFK